MKTAGSIRERLAGRHVGDPLARGEGPRLSTEVPDRKLDGEDGEERSRRGLPEGTLETHLHMGKA